MTLSPTGKVFTRSRSTRIANRIGFAAVVSIGLAMITAAVFVHFAPGDAAARWVFGGLGSVMTLIGAAAWGDMKRHEVQYALRSVGLEVIEPDAMPRFVSWAQITDLKWRMWKGMFEVLGSGDHLLARISPRIEGLGELLNTIVREGVVPKRRVALPYHSEKAYPAVARGVFLLIAILTLIPAVIFLVQDRNPGGLIFPGVFGVFYWLESYFTPRRVTVDRSSISIESGRETKQYPWGMIEGASLVVLRGPKGEVRVAAALKLLGGGWLPIRVPGIDPIDLLAAIASVDPAKIIPSPDRLIGTGTALFGWGAREAKGIDNLLRYM